MCGTHVRDVVCGVWRVILSGREWKSPLWEQGFRVHRDVGFGIASGDCRRGLVLQFHGSSELSQERSLSRSIQVFLGCSHAKLMLEYGVEHQPWGTWLGFQSWCEKLGCMEIKSSEYVGLGV